MIDANPVNPERIFCELSPAAAVERHPRGRLRLVGELVRAAPEDPRGRPGIAVGHAGDDGLRRVPYAIGAKFAHPDRPAIAMVGDGAMQMNGLAELITVAKYWTRVDRPAADRRGPAQQRPQPGDLGAAGDGGLAEVRGVPGAARR